MSVSGENWSTLEFSAIRPEKRFEHLEPKFWSRTSCIQFAYGLLVSQAAFGIGLSFAFSAVLIPQLQESNFPLTLDDEAWITSILALSAPISCIPSGILLDKFGRRAMLCFAFAPMAVGWLFVALSSNTTYIILGRAITGLGNGIAAVSCRTYIIEITLPKMRNVVGTFPNLFLTFGALVQAVLGAVLDWSYICYICAAHGLFFFMLHLCVPETPYFPLKIGDRLHARECLQKFRAKDHDVTLEMKTLIDFAKRNKVNKLERKHHYSFIFTTEACRPFFIVCGYLVLSQFSGLTVVMVSTVDILVGSYASEDPYVGNIILGVFRFLGMLLMSYLIFKVKRRPLALISSFGVSVSTLLITTFILLTEHGEEHEHILPMSFFITYSFMGSLGHLTLPVMMVFEMLPLQIRGSLGGLTMTLLYLTHFITTVSFPYLRNLVGYGYVFAIYSIFSVICFFFLLFLLPETNGLSLMELEHALKSKKREIRPSVGFNSNPHVIFMSYPSLHRDVERKNVKDNINNPSVNINDNHDEVEGEESDDSDNQETSKETSYIHFPTFK